MKRAAVVCPWLTWPGLVLSIVWALGGCTTTTSSSRNQVTEPDPVRAAELNLELGIDYLRKGNLQQAKEKIDRSLEQNPRSARAHGIAGMLYDRLGQANKADSHFQRAISLDQKDPELRNNYAVYLCQRERYERGEKMAIEAAQNPLYKTPAIAWLNAGNCARQGGNLKRAEENYRKALSVSPRFGAALLQMAELEYGQQQYLPARAFLERYLAVERTSPVTLWLGVRIERGLGNHTQAQHYAQRLKNEYPTAAQTRELLESERNPG